MNTGDKPARCVSVLRDGERKYMREHLFRGIRTDNGELVYGNLIYSENETGFDCRIVTAFLADNNDKCTIMVRAYKIKPETVSQFTGAHDKKETRIFDGDILRIFYNDEFPEDGFTDYEVRFTDENPGYNLICKDRGHEEFYSMAKGLYKRGTVIGNIFDGSALCPPKAGSAERHFEEAFDFSQVRLHSDKIG